MTDINQLRKKFVKIEMNNCNNEIDQYIEDCKYKGDKGSLIILKKVMMQKLTLDQIDNIDAYLTMQQTVGEGYRSQEKIDDEEWEDLCRNLKNE